MQPSNSEHEGEGDRDTVDAKGRVRTKESKNLMLMIAMSRVWTHLAHPLLIDASEDGSLEILIMPQITLDGLA
jgi:hypothetical protein